MSLVAKGHTGLYVFVDGVGQNRHGPLLGQQRKGDQKGQDHVHRHHALIVSNDIFYATRCARRTLSQRLEPVHLPRRARGEGPDALVAGEFQESNLDGSGRCSGLGGAVAAAAASSFMSVSPARWRIWSLPPFLGEQTARLCLAHPSLAAYLAPSRPSPVFAPVIKTARPARDLVGRDALPSSYSLTKWAR